MGHTLLTLNRIARINANPSAVSRAEDLILQMIDEEEAKMAEYYKKKNTSKRMLITQVFPH